MDAINMNRLVDTSSTKRSITPLDHLQWLRSMARLNNRCRAAERYPSAAEALLFERRNVAGKR